MTQKIFPLLKAVLFDWDNTIVDNQHLISRAKHNLFERMDMEYPKELSHYAASRKNLLRAYFPENINKANAIFEQELEKFSHDDLVLFPEILETINILKERNLLVGVVSNKRSDLLRKEIEYFDLTNTLDVVVGSGDTEYDKPHPQPLIYASSCLSMELKNILFIGDSIIDFTSASSAECHFIGYNLSVDGYSITISNHLALVKILESDFRI